MKFVKNLSQKPRNGFPGVEKDEKQPSTSPACPAIVLPAPQEKERVA
jgi:hypothetical protein